jgi:hypothetical protein
MTTTYPVHFATVTIGGITFQAGETGEVDVIVKNDAANNARTIHQETISQADWQTVLDALTPVVV